MIPNTAPNVALKDVKWRIDSEPKQGRARYVPFIDARIAARLMDEWVTPGAWSSEFRTVTITGKEAMLCTVSVWDGDKWVSKQDVGVASSNEPQKGAVSDALKRCVSVQWGAGRNVYDLPTLFAPCKVIERAGKSALAYPNDQTLPELLRQLKARGFDADGTSLEDEHESAGAGAGSTRVDTQPPVPARSKNAGAEEDDEPRPKAVIEGRPKTAPANKTVEVTSKGKSKKAPSPASSAASTPLATASVPTPPVADAVATTSDWIPPAAEMHDALALRKALYARGVSIADVRRQEGLPKLEDVSDEATFRYYQRILAELDTANPVEVPA